MDHQVEISLDSVCTHRPAPNHRPPLWIGDRRIDRGHRSIEHIAAGVPFVTDAAEAARILRLHSGEIVSADPPQAVIDAKAEYDSKHALPTPRGDLADEPPIKDFRVRS